jgi:membrane associated rhomboid family serine protease
MSDEPNGKLLKFIRGTPYPMWIAVAIWAIVGGLVLAFVVNFMPAVYVMIAAGIVGCLIGVTFALCLRRWPPSNP